MKRILSIIIGICASICVYIACADSTVSIPLTHGKSFFANTAAQTESTDDSGSSTVEPIDPNLATAELTGNTLKVYEGMEGDAYISVRDITHQQVVLGTKFDQSITLILTDTAQYILFLSHPEIGDVYGKFHYPADNAHKVMQDGRLFIRLGKDSYSSTGVKIQ